MPEKTFQLDLFKFGFIRRLFLSRLFPYVIQILLIGVIFVFVLNGWGVGSGESASFLKILRKTNATTLTIWGLWWPCMVLAAIFLGRAWCTICPLELVNNIAQRVGFKLGTARPKTPRFLKLGFGILFIYVLLQILVGVVSLHRVPFYTSVMLLALLGLAALSGLIFREPRSICAGFCPANLLLPVYGRLSRFEIDVRDRGVCAACKTKDCFRPDRLGRWHGRSCPSRVRVFRREKADPCVLCFQCAKACPYDNVGFGIVGKGSGTGKRPLLSTAEALFLFVVSGFIMHELFTEMKPLESIYHYVPERFRDATGWASHWNWIHTGWYLFVFPALVWGAALLLGKIVNPKKSFGEVFRIVGTAAFPVVAAGHASKALAKLNSWAGFIPFSLFDPNGMAEARAIVGGLKEAPGHIVPFSFIAILAFLMSISIAFFSWRRLRELERENRVVAQVGLGAIALLYCGVLFLWPWPFAH